MKYIKSDISGKILFLGPDYKNHRGGIGAIIGTYNEFIEDFKFIPTFRPYDSNIIKALFFFKQIFVIASKLMFDKEIEIVHIHGSHSGSFFRKLVIFWLSKKIFHKKVIYHLNSSSFDLFYNRSNNTVKSLIRFMMENVDVLICVSPWWKNFYETTFQLKSIIIVNNAVPEPKLPLFQKDTYAKPLKLLFLGRIGDRKGIFDLMTVIAQNKSSYDGQLKLYVGGDGETEKLEKMIIDSNLQGIVEYVGWVDNEKKLKYLTDCNVYILPSYNEGLPVSILEAMSYQMPIISTTVGGTPVVVENGVNGFIFNPGDLAAISGSIEYLLLNTEKVKQFGESSAKKVEPYLPKNVAEQLVTCYNQLLI